MRGGSRDPCSLMGLSAHHRPSAMHRILIVDDDADVAQLLATILSERFEIRVAVDGDEALACAVGFVPDVAILDLGLPGMDGFQAARRLRNLFGDSVRLIAFSGWQHVSEQQALLRGFDAMLHKPASTETLLRAVNGEGHGIR